MRELTLQGFLKEYLRYLGRTNTLSLRRLTNTVLQESPRIAEPLYLYAAVTDQRKRLVRILSVEASAHEDGPLGFNPARHYLDEYLQLNEIFSASDELLKALESKDHRIPPRYQKVYDSYRAKKNKALRDRRYSEMIHETITKLQRDLGVSNYRLYTDLKLNPGNINAYLKNGDATKVSRKTASRLLEYFDDLKRRPQYDQKVT